MKKSRQVPGRGWRAAAALALAALAVLLVAVRPSAETPAGRLQAALAAAKGGAVIVLADGDYGRLTVSQRFADEVTIRSETRLGARFEAIAIADSSYLRLDGLHVDAQGNGTPAEALIEIENSDHIAVINSEMNGKADDVFPVTGYFGIRARNSADITVSGSFAHDVLNGMAFFGIDRLALHDNRVDRLGGDGFKFAGVDTALIANNTGPGHIYAEDDVHEDFMQFQGSASKNVTIRGNVFLPQNVFDVQGIFVAGDGGHSNILIEDNIIYTGMANGIYVAGGSTGIVVRSNTLIAADAAVTRIAVPAGAEVSGNIASGNDGALQGTNLTIQGSDASAAYYIGDLFPAVVLGRGIALADLRPAPGSLAETMGAAARLRDLLP